MITWDIEAGRSLNDGLKLGRSHIFSQTAGIIECPVLFAKLLNFILCIAVTVRKQKLFLI